VDFAELLGFKVRWARLCAADYGVPQVRWHAFIVGCKSADPSHTYPPKKTHLKPETGTRRLFNDYFDEYVDNPEPWRDVWSAIGDLPPPEGVGIRRDAAPLDLHFGKNPTDKSKARYRAVPDEGTNRFDLYRRAPELTPNCWIRKGSGGTDVFGRL
jgi:DNA (cytosine-5)-methyltransferase 1